MREIILIFYISITISWLPDAAALVHSKLLQLPGGFKLEARVHVNYKGRIEDVRATEYYSNEQMRAKLEISGLWTDMAAHDGTRYNYYYQQDKGRTGGNTRNPTASTSSRLVKTPPFSALATRQRGNGTLAKSAYCKPTSEADFLYDLFGQLGRDNQILRDWLRPKEGVPSYIIGLARLFLIAQVNRDSMELEMNGQNPFRVRIRNQSCKRYNLLLNNWSGQSVITNSDNKSQESVELYALYGGGDGSPLVSDLGDLPMRIWLTLDKVTVFFIDYSIIRPLPDDGHGPKSMVDDDDDQGTELFTLPVNYGCSRQLEPLGSAASAKFDSIRSRFAVWPVVSMHAEIEEVWLRDWIASPKSGHKPLISRHFIAYDGLQQAARYDTIGDNTNNGYSISLSDLKLDKNYHIQLKRTSGLSQTNPSGQQQATNSMSTTTISYSGEWRDPKRSLVECVVARSGSAKLLMDKNGPIPFDKLVDLGETTVRGIRARVLEYGGAKELPPLIFANVLFKDYQGHQVTAYDPFMLGSELTIVYYVAHDDDPMGSFDDVLVTLLRVDVWNKLGKLYQVEVYDYLWQLQEAPNGDQQVDLFALKDRCNGGGDGDDGNRLRRMSTLSLELDYIKQNKFDNRTSEMIQMIQARPLMRDLALLRSLSGMPALGGGGGGGGSKSAITATTVHGIESRTRLVSSASKVDQLQLLASLRLSNVRDTVLEAEVIGTGLVLAEARASGFGSNSFINCYWEAAHRRAHGDPILFAFHGGQCYIDEQPKIEWVHLENGTLLSQFGGSSMFKLDWGTKHPMSVYKFDWEPEAKMNLRVSRWAVYSELKQKMLDLPFLWNEQQNPMRACQYEKLEFQIQRVELSNNKWPLETLQDTDEILKGVGLIDGQAVGDLSGQSTSLASSTDLSVCHSACVLDMNCRSFSACINMDRLECIKSEISFRDERLLSQIENKSERSKKLSRNDKIQLEINATCQLKDDDDDDSSVDKTTQDSINSTRLPGQERKQQTNLRLELKVDKRCRIYNKRALDLFQELPKSLTSLKNRQIYQVDNEEMCAEKCLDKNARYLKRMARLKSESLQTLSRDLISQSNSLYMEQLNKIRRHYLENQKFWCATFKYLNLATSSVSTDLLGNLELKSVDRGGICLLSRLPQSNAVAPKPGVKQTNQTGRTNKQQSLTVTMDMFEFVYKNLYQVEAGIRLLPFDLTAASNQSGAEQREDKPILENKQLAMKGSDIELCAKQCFTQAIELQPYCKSIDLIEVGDWIGWGNTKKLKTTSFCVFNSISLAEARASGQYDGLVSGKFGKEYEVVKMWHYEPREEYLLDGVILKRLLDRETDRAGETARVGSSLAVIIVIIIALVTGIVAGTYLKAPVANYCLNNRTLPGTIAKIAVDERDLTKDTDDPGL